MDLWRIARDLRITGIDSLFFILNFKLNNLYKIRKQYNQSNY